MDSQDTFDVTLTHIWQELRVIRALLEKKQANPSLDGWLVPNDRSEPAGSHPSSQRASELVDFSKRIEFCFKETADQFVDWRTTNELVKNIDQSFGRECLRQFVRHCEDTYMGKGATAIARPERMQQFFERWLSSTGTVPR